MLSRRRGNDVRLAHLCHGVLTLLRSLLHAAFGLGRPCSGVTGWGVWTDVVQDAPMLKVLELTSEKVFVPLCIGGGIRDYVDIQVPSLTRLSQPSAVSVLL